jgi:hypothetical protein
MTTRPRDKRVTFTRPFELRGLDGIQSPGTYSVATHEDGAGFFPFSKAKRLSTWIRICRNPGVEGAVEHVNIDPLELRAALIRDTLPDRR